MQDFHGFGLNAIENQIFAVDAAANACLFIAADKRMGARHHAEILTARIKFIQECIGSRRIVLFDIDTDVEQVGPRNFGDDDFSFVVALHS